MILFAAPIAGAYGRSEKVIDRGAALVAGKPIDAGCPTSDPEWESEKARVFGQNRPGVQGYADVGGSRVRLAPWICRVLDGQPHGTNGDPVRRTVGAALNILGHEASHARGVADEATASCEGLAWTDDLVLNALGVTMLRRGGLTPAGQVAKAIAESRALHATLSPEHRSICP